jgi:hypothetical protein
MRKRRVTFGGHAYLRMLISVTIAGYIDVDSIAREMIRFDD